MQTKALQQLQKRSSLPRSQLKSWHNFWNLRLEDFFCSIWQDVLDSLKLPISSINADLYWDPRLCFPVTRISFSSINVQVKKITHWKAIPNWKKSSSDFCMKFLIVGKLQKVCSVLILVGCLTVIFQKLRVWFLPTRFHLKTFH